MSTTTQDGSSNVEVDAAEAPLEAAPVAGRGVVPVTTSAKAAAKAKAKGTVATTPATGDTPVIPATTVVTAPKRPKAPSRERTFGTKVAGQPAFVLHSYPYKETSLIIDLFTRDFGRVALIAKGAKRPHSQLRGVLQTFQPLSSSWVGKSELRTLTDAEWVGGMLPLEKTALLCGFYLNELLVKLLARDDAHPALFDHYVATLNQLAHNEPAPIVLRKFERALLKETGVSADLSRCTTTRGPVRADVVYVVDPERGPRPERASDQSPRVTGKTLLDMEREDYRDAATQSQSKQLMRYLLAHHLGGAPLNTRQILIDLSQL